MVLITVSTLSASFLEEVQGLLKETLKAQVFSHLFHSISVTLTTTYQ